MDALYNGLGYVRQTEPQVHSTIFDRIRLHQVESQMTSILLARKKVFEGIMSRLHFT